MRETLLPTLNFKPEVLKLLQKKLFTNLYPQLMEHSRNRCLVKDLLSKHRPNPFISSLSSRLLIILWFQLCLFMFKQLHLHSLAFGTLNNLSTNQLMCSLRTLSNNLNKVKD